MKRSGLAAPFYLAIVFLSGALVGGFGYRLYTFSPVSAASKASQNPDEYRRRYMGEMRSRLKLDDAQTTKINEILDSTRQQYREFNTRHKAELSGIHNDQVARISAILSAPQRSEYDTMRQERDRRRK